jgi:hypothetical protein
MLCVFSMEHRSILCHPPVSFSGTGVYALYYTGQLALYQKYYELNRLAYNHPIYVGKAVPKGWRQSRIAAKPANQTKELCTHLNEHRNNIAAGANLLPTDFMCRFMIFENDGSGMISTIEAALIKIHRPLWHVALDGFGNHTPGNGRFQQAKSDWDVIHPGREWAEKCSGYPTPLSTILSNIETHFQSLG